MIHNNLPSAIDVCHNAWKVHRPYLYHHIGESFAITGKDQHIAPFVEGTHVRLTAHRLYGLTLVYQPHGFGHEGVNLFLIGAYQQEPRLRVLFVQPHKRSN